MGVWTLHGQNRPHRLFFYCHAHKIVLTATTAMKHLEGHEGCKLDRVTLQAWKYELGGVPQ